MTGIGIEYLKYLETKRANQAKEAQYAQELDETKRSNIARESISQATLAETYRSNVAKEELQRSSLDEQIRSNIAQENLSAHRTNLDYQIRTAQLEEQKEARIKSNEFTEQQLANQRYATNLSTMSDSVAPFIAAEDAGYSDTKYKNATAFDSIYDKVTGLVNFAKLFK